MRCTAKILYLLPALLLISTAIYAQRNGGLHDVIYFKDSSVLRVRIIETYAYDSVKVDHGYGTAVYKMSDISRIRALPYRYHVIYRKQVFRYEKAHGPRKSLEILPVTYVERDHCYFFQGQLLLKVFQGGMRIINGYKFNQACYLGGGIGFDYVMGSISGGDIDITNQPMSDRFTGPSVPLFLYYAADFTPRRFTPHAYIELGYALGPKDKKSINGSNKPGGGVMWAAGIGLKLHSQKRFNFNVNFDLSFKQVWATVQETRPVYGGPRITSVHPNSQVLVFPGIRMGFGF